MNVARVEFQNRMDGVKQYMAFRKVGGELEARVSFMSVNASPKIIFYDAFRCYRQIAFRLVKNETQFIEQIIKRGWAALSLLFHTPHRRMPKIPKRFICDFYMWKNIP